MRRDYQKRLEFLCRTFSAHSDECVEWPFARCTDDYGEFSIFGLRRAHRVAYQLGVGDIPKGMHVLHRCDNPLCVNIRHLWLGTHAENMRDMRNKGRGGLGTLKIDNRGSRHPKARINESDVLHIRTLISQGMSHKEIGSIYGLKRCSITDISLRRTWKHI